MIRCKYCGRNLKFDYETCPGCGGSKFEKILDYKEKVIKDPPNGGYKIEFNSYGHELKNAKLFKYIGYVLIAIAFLVDIFMFDLGMDRAFYLILIVINITFIGSGILFTSIGISNQNENEKEKEKVERLSKTGLLVKNLNYEIIYIGTQMNITKPVYKIKVFYENQTGVKVPFISNTKYDRVPTGSTGTADLLIDPSDFSNYYIDFEIV